MMNHLFDPPSQSIEIPTVNIATMLTTLSILEILTVSFVPPNQQHQKDATVHPFEALGIPQLRTPTFSNS